MHQLYNGTPIPIRGMAEGHPYWFTPGEIKDIREDDRAETLLNNYADVGLREIKFGDDIAKVKQECLDAFLEHVSREADAYNQHQIGQARKGLEQAPPMKQLESFVSIYNNLTGEKVVIEASDDPDADPTLLVIRTLAKSAAKSKNPEQAARYKQVVEDLVSAKSAASAESRKAVKLLDAQTVSAGPGPAARARVGSKRAAKRAKKG